jgi:hypothetical protein
MVFLSDFQTKILRARFYVCCMSSPSHLSFAMSWLKWLVTGLSPRKAGFPPGSARVGFFGDQNDITAGLSPSF